ncbi:hypothetical protein BS47DRAFT_1487986 [Hydnum rufescens UP504]|uniref:Uncharacterized protein n=1 Tax=Hydnum rufescens UP504 TaxID=1448309 RepID=A0A9P6AP45_9AGAM|nr:hypothetical protein BS47DRAFT_1487986 [Hydnum rufescens UP504]
MLADVHRFILIRNGIIRQHCVYLGVMMMNISIFSLQLPAAPEGRQGQGTEGPGGITSRPFDLRYHTQYQTESSFTWCPLHTFVDGIVTEIGSSLRRRVVLYRRESLFGWVYLDGLRLGTPGTHHLVRWQVRVHLLPNSRTILSLFSALPFRKSSVEIETVDGTGTHVQLPPTNRSAIRQSLRPKVLSIARMDVISVFKANKRHISFKFIYPRSENTFLPSAFPSPVVDRYLRISPCLLPVAPVGSKIFTLCQTLFHHRRITAKSDPHEEAIASRITSPSFTGATSQTAKLGLHIPTAQSILDSSLLNPSRPCSTVLTTHQARLHIFTIDTHSNLQQA